MFITRNLFLFLLIILSFHALQAQENQVIDFTKIELENLEGLPIDLNAYKGKVVLLNFWATWCRSCVYEIPSIERAGEKLKDEDIVFLLASDEGPGRINKFSKKNGYDLNFIRLKSSYKEANLKYIPTTLIIGKDGNLKESHIGYKDWSNRSELKKLIAYIKE